MATTSGTLAAVLVMIALAGVTLFAWRQRRHSPSRAAKITARDFALIAAVAIIVVLTLNPNDQASQPRKWLLVPFEDLRNALAGHQSLGLAVIGIVGNVALFVPLGVALRWRFPRLELGGAAWIGFGTSVVIEALQAVIPGSRWSDTTDVITNVAGALVGAALPGDRTDHGASVRGPPGPR